LTLESVETQRSVMKAVRQRIPSRRPTVQNSDELIYFKPLEKCMTFKDIFPRLSRTSSINFSGLFRTKVIFQDFPCPGIFKKKIQDFPGGVGTLNIANVCTTAQTVFHTESSPRLCPTTESRDVNRHTARRTIPVSVVWQCKLVSG